MPNDVGTPNDAGTDLGRDDAPEPSGDAPEDGGADAPAGGIHLALTPVESAPIAFPADPEATWRAVTVELGPSMWRRA